MKPSLSSLLTINETNLSYAMTEMEEKIDHFIKKLENISTGNKEISVVTSSRNQNRRSTI
ncbi:hypothetical protein HZS_5660 [Henneguya salminicola]|nr:hypothetical protein HZS_5660 [Henneguya salminicola]